MLALSLSLLATGCLSPLNKRSVAFSGAVTPVVDQAAAAYHDANAIHDLRVDYDAVAEFDAKEPVYNPRHTEELLPDKDLDARLKVLAALQLYAKNLTAITNGTDSPALQDASKALGGALSSGANSIAPSIESSYGISSTPASTTQTTVTTVSGNTTSTTTSTSSTPKPVISADTQNAISTAVNALGQYLISRKIKKELPGKIEAMDPHIQALCKLLQDDAGLLQDQERRDYNRIIDEQTLFIRVNKTLDPQTRRTEIMKLPEIVRQQRTADQKLATLHDAIERLAKTHSELSAEAQGKNPESLKDKLQELSSAAGELGTYYSSLSASDSKEKSH